MSFIDALETANQTPEPQKWKGTFRDFLRLYETGSYDNLGILAHERVYDMILSSGVETKDFFGKTRTYYKHFEDELFGLEYTVDNLMSYLHSAAQKTETSRRMLLLYGPPSSGKSMLVWLIKRGLEKYSRTQAGALFSLEGSKMHENPFLLVPESLRPEFEKQYGLRIEGHLSPTSRYRLEHEFNGKFMEYPVEQTFFSEEDRIGIGTWLPSDTKGQDISELVGGIDFARIQEFGSEADPRAYNFDGELNVANRGIMEFIEGLKADEKFLRSNLTATQEKTIKAPRFGLIYVDCLIIMHTNETEFTAFMSEPKYEAYHDRMVIIRVPYNMSVRNEVKIYNKLLASSKSVKDITIAPNTLEAAAMFAILTRLEPAQDELNLVKKMKLYDGQHVKGFKKEQVFDIRKKNEREGMFGASPRFVIDQISCAISIARTEGRNYITALDVLRQLNKGIKERDSFKKDEKNQYEGYIDTARSEWNDILKNDIQKAFFLSFEDEAKNMCENYIDHITAACSGTKPRDPITNEETDLNHKLMDSIEGYIDISSSGKEDFRNEILRYVAMAGRKGQKFDYTQHSQLKEAIQKHLFAERQGTIRMTVSSHNPDPESIRRLNEVIDRMVQQQGYSSEAANELLKYATAHLFDK
jgi:serine protein kinase